MRTGVIDLCEEYQVDVINNLVKTNLVSFEHILYRKKIHFHGNYDKVEKLILDQGEKTNFDSITKFLFGNKIIDLSSVPFTLSESLVNEVKHIESMFYRITDRAASLPISIHERKLYYLLLLNYFNNIITKNKLELIIAFETPHSFFSMIYFELAKYYNLKVILLEYHFFQDMCIVLNQFQYPEVPITFNQGKSLEEIKEEIPSFIKTKLIEKNSYVSNYKEKEKKKVKRKNSNLKLYLSLVKKKISNFILALFPHLIKPGINHFTSLNNVNGNFKYRITLNKLIYKLYKTNKYYNKVAKNNPDLNAKYIFFGLHMQPEKTSQPLGNESDNQFYPIFLISKNLPDGWKIYVKDHPNQFNLKKVSNRNYRSRNYYDAILKLGNVELVSFETSADDLMKNAQAIATLSGTIGWEGLTMGKPVLAFGNPYYIGCRSVHQISNSQEMKDFFENQIMRSSEEVLSDFYNYLIYYFNNSYLSVGSNFEVKMALSEYPKEWHVEKLSNQITNCIKEF